MKIIVTGSLGNVGKSLTAELVQKGHQVIGIIKDQEKQKDLEALGANAAVGSLDETEFLVSTFNGADAVFCMIPPNYTTTDSRGHYRKIGNCYAEAIKETGVKRAVHLSSWGAHLDKGTGFILGSHDVEGILNELTNTAVTHLRSGFIDYNLYNFVGMIKGMGFIGANYGGNDKIVIADPKDIAVAATEELQMPSSGKNVRYVASEDMTANEVAQILGEAIGNPNLKWETFTDEQARIGMEQQGLPAEVIANAIELGAAIHSGKMREDYDLHKPTAMGKVKIKDFAKEFAVAFSKT